jgi:hypothetical protein
VVANKFPAITHGIAPDPMKDNVTQSDICESRTVMRHKKGVASFRDRTPLPPY